MSSAREETELKPVWVGDTVIVGAGAAGLAAAAFAVGRVCLVERLARPGVKLLATGGGRCNVTHDTDAAGMLSAFGTKARGLASVFWSWEPDAIRDYLEMAGVPTHVESDGCVFPDSGRARDVLEALWQAAQARGVSFFGEERVTRLVLDEAHACVRGVLTQSGHFYQARRVILATGGCAMPTLGSDGSGFAMLREVGVDIVDPVPALVPLCVAEPWVSSLAGVSCETAKLSILGGRNQTATGAVLVTHRGLSGPAALALSGDVSVALKSMQTVTVTVAWNADQTVSDWLDYFQMGRQYHGARRVVNCVGERLPKSLAEQLCERAGVSTECVVARMSRTQLETLATYCGACPMTVTSTEGFQKAMVTRGGVPLKALNSKTLSIRGIEGLSVVGELIDVDAPCGGYQLTWAFASGRFAMESTHEA